MKSPSERFWPKVNKNGPTMPHMTTPCWVWTGAYLRGYGEFKLAGRRHLAHRVAWEMANGPIPDGLWVLHKCDNPPCVREDHLFLGTVMDNVADMDAKGRRVSARGDEHGSHLHPESRARGDRNGSRLHPESRPRGEENGRAKLTEEKVRTIFRLRREGWTQARIAEEMSVGHSIIGYILAREKWAHLQLGAST